MLILLNSDRRSMGGLGTNEQQRATNNNTTDSNVANAMDLNIIQSGVTTAKRKQGDGQDLVTQEAPSKVVSSKAL